MKKFTIRPEKMNNNQLQEPEENRLFVLISVLAGFGITVILSCIGIAFVSALFWLVRSREMKN